MSGEFLAFSLLPSINQENQGSLAVVVNWMFTLVSVDLRASLFIDHCHVILFFVCQIFAVGLDHEIILITKFS